MLIYSSNINIFSINCVELNILLELDIFVVSRLFEMSNTLYNQTLRINVNRKPKGKSTMVNPEKLATLGTKTQDKDKQIKNATQHALDTTMSKQAAIT